MQYDELELVYGEEAAKKLVSSLTATEMQALSPLTLLPYLQAQVDIESRQYLMRVENSYINRELGEARDEYVELPWCAAKVRSAFPRTTLCSSPPPPKPPDGKKSSYNFATCFRQTVMQR